MIKLRSGARQAQHWRTSSTDSRNSGGPAFRRTDIFLEPFEDGICVCDNLTKTHRLLFNKYPCREHHVLVVTKHREQQGELLNFEDFKASLIVLRAFQSNAVVFYNSSPTAGASQSHKHLQVMPVASIPGKKVPINERAMETLSRNKASADEQGFVLPEYVNMRHHFSPIEPDLIAKPGTDEELKEVAKQLERIYMQTLKQVNNPEGRVAYNFAMTKDWMLIMVRRHPEYRGLHVNTLGFLGLLFADSEEKVKLIEETRPLEVLRALAMPMHD